MLLSERFYYGNPHTTERMTKQKEIKAKGKTSNENGKKETITYVFLLLLVICFLLWTYCRGSYLYYHVRIHGIPTWGKVVNVKEYIAHHYSSKIEYRARDSIIYTHYSGPMAPMRLGDSVIVYYDTTRYKESFVPLRNKRDIETAFFLSEKRLIPFYWEKNYQNFQEQLAIMRKEHKERKHWYDQIMP